MIIKQTYRYLPFSVKGKDFFYLWCKCIRVHSAAWRPQAAGPRRPLLAGPASGRRRRRRRICPARWLVHHQSLLSFWRCGPAVEPQLIILCLVAPAGADSESEDDIAELNAARREYSRAQPERTKDGRKKKKASSGGFQSMGLSYPVSSASHPVTVQFQLHIYFIDNVAIHIRYSREYFIKGIRFLPRFSGSASLSYWMARMLSPWLGPGEDWYPCGQRCMG